MSDLPDLKDLFKVLCWNLILSRSAEGEVISAHLLVGLLFGIMWSDVSRGRVFHNFKCQCSKLPRSNSVQSYKQQDWAQDTALGNPNKYGEIRKDSVETFALTVVSGRSLKARKEGGFVFHRQKAW